MLYSTHQWTSEQQRQEQGWSRRQLQGQAQSQSYELTQLAGMSEQAKPGGSQSVEAEQSQTAVMAAGSAQCNHSTGRPRGSQD